MAMEFRGKQTVAQPSLLHAGQEGKGLNAMTEEKFRQQFGKTRLCRYVLMGCWKGEHCTYAHDEKELRNPPNLTKTSLCTLWMEKRCPRSAADCQFAHGRRDQRVSQGFQAPNVAKQEGRFLKQQPLPEESGDASDHAKMQKGVGSGQSTQQDLMANPGTGTVHAEGLELGAKYVSRVEDFEMRASTFKAVNMPTTLAARSQSSPDALVDDGVAVLASESMTLMRDIMSCQQSFNPSSSKSDGEAIFPSFGMHAYVVHRFSF